MPMPAFSAGTQDIWRQMLVVDIFMNHRAIMAPMALWGQGKFARLLSVALRSVAA